MLGLQCRRMIDQTRSVSASRRFASNLTSEPTPAVATEARAAGYGGIAASRRQPGCGEHDQTGLQELAASPCCGWQVRRPWWRKSVWRMIRRC